MKRSVKPAVAIVVILVVVAVFAAVLWQFTRPKLDEPTEVPAGMWSGEAGNLQGSFNRDGTPAPRAESAAAGESPEGGPTEASEPTDMAEEGSQEEATEAIDADGATDETQGAGE